MNIIQTKFYLLLNFLLVFSPSVGHQILHLSFHQGCLTNFQQVADTLGLHVTSSFVLKDPRFSQGKFDGVTRTLDIYNMTHERADRIWQIHKEYFDQFDAIVISDTTPLSRIFLQNGWEKPLIIWICNRFDYYHEESAKKDGFPDKEYYQLIREARHKSNVIFLAYTPFELVHAQSKGVDLNCPIVRPLGTKPRPIKNPNIPDWVNKPELIFVYPRIFKQNIQTVKSGLQSANLNWYGGTYKTPDELTDFKGILYFPYQYSNLALFENLYRGIVHFVPSKIFLKKHNIYTMHLQLENIKHCEWYHEDFKDLFVYFDSWYDLKQKIETTDYATLRARILDRAEKHYDHTLTQWRHVFEGLGWLNA